MKKKAIIKGEFTDGGSGLLDAPLQLLLTLVFIAFALIWLICKGFFMLLWNMVKILAGKHNQF